MSPTKDLHTYLALNWTMSVVHVVDEADGYVRLTVAELPDFAVYGDSESEVDAQWREALASHLSGYLTVGKTIPEPVTLSDPAPTSTDAAATVLSDRTLELV